MNRGPQCHLSFHLEWVSGHFLRVIYRDRVAIVRTLSSLNSVACSHHRLYLKDSGFAESGYWACNVLLPYRVKLPQGLVPMLPEVDHKY